MPRNANSLASQTGPRYGLGVIANPNTAAAEARGEGLKKSEILLIVIAILIVAILLTIGIPGD
jgi:hypothetical protein